MCLRRFLLPGVLLALLLTADLAGAVVPAAVDEANGGDRPQAAMERALQHYRDGKLNEAAGLLRGFLVSYPDSSLIDEAYRQLAAIHADMEEPQRALAYLAEVAPQARTPLDRLLEGRLKIHTAAAQEGLAILMSLPLDDLSPADKQARFLLLAAGTAELGRAQAALYFLYEALRTAGQLSANDVLAKIHVLMDTQLEAADLQEAAFMYRGSPVALLAMLKLGWLALENGDRGLARQRAEQVLDGPTGFAYRDEALALFAQVTDPNELQRAVGVLLPLSGRYAAFGKLVQRGIEQARQDFRPAIPVRFLYRDTAGDPDLAAQLVAELASGERVLGIIGPLVGSAAEEAAQRAGQAQVPLLSLSQREGLAATSPYVFRNSLTMQLQVATLLEYAMGDLGMTSFGILHPKTRQGEAMAALFSTEVARRGGRLVNRQSYQPDQTDFRREIRLLRGLDPNAPDEEENPQADNHEETPPPFEALFLPDYADRVSMVAPQLPFYGLDGVQLLGTNGWNNPELLKAAGRSVEGAIFVDGFFRQSPYPFVQEFAANYFAAYGEDPTILEAQGYDAAGILLTLLEDPLAGSRAGLRWALSQMPIYPGVTGAARFDFQGEAVKSLFLLEIQNGAIVQIN